MTDPRQSHDSEQKRRAGRALPSWLAEQAKSPDYQSAVPPWMVQQPPMLPPPLPKMTRQQAPVSQRSQLSRSAQLNPVQSSHPGESDDACRYCARPVGAHGSCLTDGCGTPPPPPPSFATAFFALAAQVFVVFYISMAVLVLVIGGLSQKHSANHPQQTAKEQSTQPSSADSDSSKTVFGFINGEYVIPLQNASHCKSVSMRINGKPVPGVVEVDTGAMSCCLTPAMAQQLGLDLKLARDAGTPVGATYHVKEFTVDTVSVGCCTENKVIVQVWPLPEGVNGLVGMTFLERFSFSLDPTRNILRLKKKPEHSSSPRRRNAKSSGRRSRSTAQ